MPPLVITPIYGIPLIRANDNVGELILDGALRCQIALEEGDIFVITQKIVSKAESRLVNLATVTPSDEAEALAAQSGKDPRMVEMILRESKSILRVRPGLIIAEHKNGFVCANAGIDHSNVNQESAASENWVLLLPEDADRSAQAIQTELLRQSGKRFGVLIIDSHGRAWRNGTVGVSIGTADVPELVNRVGDYDLFGRELKATIIAAGDQLAAASALVMGETNEAIPVVHVRGFPYSLRPSSLKEVLRDKESDLFR